jgi:hypothetical protein
MTDPMTPTPDPAVSMQGDDQMLAPWFESAQAETLRCDDDLLERLVADMAAVAPPALFRAPRASWIDRIADAMVRPLAAAGGLSLAAGAGLVVGLSDGALGVLMLDSLGGLGAAAGFDLWPGDPDEVVYSLFNGS